MFSFSRPARQYYLILLGCSREPRTSRSGSPLPRCTKGAGSTSTSTNWTNSNRRRSSPAGGRPSRAKLPVGSRATSWVRRRSCRRDSKLSASNTRRGFSWRRRRRWKPIIPSTLIAKGTVPWKKGRPWIWARCYQGSTMRRSVRSAWASSISATSGTTRPLKIIKSTLKSIIHTSCHEKGKPGSVRGA